MCDNYIVINGKKAELTDEQLKALGISVGKENPYQCKENGYFVNVFGEVSRLSINVFIEKAREYYRYFATEKFAKQTYLRELLERKLWAFSYENGYNKDMIHNGKRLINCYFIQYNKNINHYFVDSIPTMYSVGVPYFISTEICQRAIDEVLLPFLSQHPDFVWGV